VTETKVLVFVSMCGFVYNNSIIVSITLLSFCTYVRTTDCESMSRLPLSALDLLVHTGKVALELHC
jgi:hypothetical protein